MIILQTEITNILLNKGIITADQLHIASLEQQKQKRLLSEILIDLQFVNEQVMGALLSSYSGYTYVDIQKELIDFNLLQNFDLSICIEQLFLPFKIDTCLHVAMADPENIIIQDIIKKYVRNIVGLACDCNFYHSSAAVIKNVLLQSMSPDIEQPDAPFEKLFTSLFRNAVLEQSSDIHFVPCEQMVEVKTRVHGNLEMYTRLELPIYNKFVVKLKLLAKLDIAENRQPQSGGCLLKVDNHNIDCRISFHPTLWGESLVVRLLATNRKALKLSELGFNEQQILQLKHILNSPFGLFLVSGATGSGKTTTLHALLQELDVKGLNVMTLEQPIEYRVLGVRQTEIQEELGMTFADGIRSILRHDPDVLLIGEIRDEDTAKMALRAAMTGHLVLATIHSSSAYTAPVRLIDLGIAPQLLSGQIIGVLDQTLVKLVDQKKRIAKGELVIFNDSMHQIIGEGGNPLLLKKAYQNITPS